MTRFFFSHLSGLQHEVIHPSDPFGLPLDFETLPGQLREVGKRPKINAHVTFSCFIYQLNDHNPVVVFSTERLYNFLNTQTGLYSQKKLSMTSVNGRIEFDKARQQFNGIMRILSR